MKCNFEEGDWESLCTSSQCFSFNSRHKLTQYNLIHRTYFTPLQITLNKASVLSVLPKMQIRNGDVGTYVLDSPCLNSYWMSIMKMLNDITGLNIPTEPRVILLGDTSMIKVNRNQLKFIRIALITANKCIAMHWKMYYHLHLLDGQMKFEVKRLCTI